MKPTYISNDINNLGLQERLQYMKAFPVGLEIIINMLFFTSFSLFLLAEEFYVFGDAIVNGEDYSLQCRTSVYSRNGAIYFSQSDTEGIGVFSGNFDTLPFTQGISLRSLVNASVFL